MSARFDIVLQGATGFTGKLVAEHFVRNYMSKTSIKFAMAGRSQSKLEQLRASLISINEAAKEIPLILCNALDDDSVDAMVRQTRVVLTTVGPYLRYGTPLVAKCAELGVDYCDLTGEVVWMHQTIREFHEIAQVSHARIIHCCGFDSVPTDICVNELTNYLRDKYGEGTLSMNSYLKVFGAEGSGGTIESGFNQMDHPNAQLAKDMYALYPVGEAPGTDRLGIFRTPKFIDVANAYTMPSIMAAINCPVAHRTNALRGFVGGRNLTVSEEWTDKSWIVAWLATIMLKVFETLILPFGPIRRLVRKFMAKPGEGPSREVMERSRWTHYEIGTHTSSTGQVRRACASLSAQGDPGYLATSRIMLECGMALIENRDELEENYGVITPAVAFGSTLIKRWRDVDTLKFELSDC